MQICRIILYSHEGLVRELPFRLGRVNIVTGPSERGKSAILSIIDYCLGARQLGVPAGVIQDAVSWYALELDFSGERLFVARPGVDSARRTSPGWYIAPGGFAEPPPLHELIQLFNREALLDRISATLGIGRTLLPRADGELAAVKVSFRSGLTYCLQKQNEIANPDLFFHRQGDPSIAQNIRDTMPYFLGAIDEEIIAKQAELKARRKRAREVQKQLDRTAAIAGRRDEEAAYLVAEARGCGLLDAPALTAPAADVTDLLELAEASSRAMLDSRGSDQLAGLAREIATLDSQRASLGHQIQTLEDFGLDQDNVLKGANEQRRRLRSLELTGADAEHGIACPLCENAMPVPTPQASDLRRSLKALEHELGFVSLDRTQVQTALAACRAELAEVIDELEAARARLGKLRQEDARVRGTLERRNTAARVGGMIQMFLRVASDRVDEDRAELEMELAALQAAIDTLESETDFASFRAKTALFLGSIGAVLTRWAQDLKLAYSAGLLTFDIRGPNLVSETDSGPINFSRFGSGKNWVWYHLLGHMALHRWFVDRQRPTPRFLALDQPSQVYFPGGDTSEAATDLEEVHRIYSWLIETTQSFGGELQVIITDHARFLDDSAFVEHVAHDWWATDGALVPPEWV